MHLFFVLSKTRARLLAAMVAPVVLVTGGLSQGTNPSQERTPAQGHTMAPYLVPAAPGALAPDAQGFLKRWLLLEPISKPNRSNAVFTNSYVRAAFGTQYFPDQTTVLPHDGDRVTVAGQSLAWHALDATLFDVKLFNFADGLDKPVYGVIFWAVTVVDSPKEQKVRLAAGSNSASMWWVNGTEAVGLFGDRRMVMDDAVSPVITLKRGANVIRGAVINGPGLSDFCVRMIDEKGGPVTDLTTSLPLTSSQDNH